MESRANSGNSMPSSIPVWKRGFDMLFIVLSAPLWLPVMALVALMIKIVSPGPVIYCQQRVGYRGRNFMIFKFRSMKVNASTNSHETHVEQLIQTNRPMTKMDAVDKRVIPGGWILRATGLDELPQILNVLRGDMSIVGPRPCIPNEFNCYKKDQKRRVDAPPGLTGLWQVNGKNRLTFTEMIALDLEYVDTMSLSVDTGIVLRTIPAIFGQLGDARLKRHEQAVVRVPVQKQPQREFAAPATVGSLGDAR
jgi:exopolysaccharide production protein ExoY